MCSSDLVFLRTSFGVDLAMARALSKGAPLLEITFGVEVNGESVATRKVTVRSSDAEEEVTNQTSHNSWVRLGPREVPLMPGDRVRLTTRLPAGAPSTLPETPAARAMTMNVVHDANDVIDELTLDGGRQMWTTDRWAEFEPRLRKWMSFWEETGRRHGLTQKIGRAHV